MNKDFGEYSIVNDSIYRKTPSGNELISFEDLPYAEQLKLVRLLNLPADSTSPEPRQNGNIRPDSDVLGAKPPESSRPDHITDKMVVGDWIPDTGNEGIIELLGNGKASFGYPDVGLFIDKNSSRVRIVADDIELAGKNIRWNGTVPMHLNSQSFIPSSIVTPIPTFILDVPFQNGFLSKLSSILKDLK